MREELFNIKFIFGVCVRQVSVILVLRDIKLIGQKWPHAAKLQDALGAVQYGKLIHGGKVFATLSSDEFKKTAAAKKNLCGCRSNWRLEAKKSPVVPGK